jgi:TRAP-type C4-dicarboxylate transport system permease small subunit
MSLPPEHDPVVEPGYALSPGASFIEDACEVLCGLALVVMIVLIGAEALARNLFGFSLQVTTEVGGYLLVAITFLSLSVAQAHGAYHHVELLQAKVSRRGRLISGIVFDLMSLLACLILTWQLARLVWNAWNQDDVAPTPLQTPLWIPQLTMPIGTTIVCITLLRTIAMKVRRLRGASRAER